MDEREISAGFKKRNILTPQNPNLDTIGQKNTIITTKCSGRAFLFQSRSSQALASMIRYQRQCRPPPNAKPI